MSDQWQKLIEQLAAKLGTTAQFLWLVLIKQAKVEAIEDVCFVLLCIPCFWFYAKYTLWCGKKCAKNEDEDIHMIGMVIFGIVCTIMFGFMLAALFEIPTMLLNPQYWALQQILDKVGK